MLVIRFEDEKKMKKIDFSKNKIDKKGTNVFHKL